MTTSPYKPLLNKEPHPDASHYSHSLTLLEELANFGSHLCKKAYENSKKSVTDAQVVFHLLRQVVADIDAIHHMLSHGLVPSAYPLLRSLLEKEHLFEWALLGDTEAKLKHLYVAAQRAERRAGKSLIPGTAENEGLKKIFGLVPTDTRLIDGARAKVSRVDRQLCHPEFADINRMFEGKNPARPQKHDPNWTKAYAESIKAHSTFSGSVEAIASAIGQLDEYRYIYSHLCTQLHGAALFGSLSLRRSSVAPKPMRGFSGYEFVFRWTSILGIRAYQKAYDNFMPQLTHEYKSVFMSWSDRFQNVPNCGDESDD